MTVFTIVVTFNRLNLLKEALEAIKKQTVGVDKIVVVNNGSTDGTSGWLQEQQDLVIIEQGNVGGAGGFHTGIKYAYENCADWIWVMDDDVKPEPDCLFELLKYGNISKCLHPSKRCMDGVDFPWAKSFDIKRNHKFYLSDNEYKNKDIFFVNTGCFEGMLIHSEIVNKIGFPDPRFFINGDDTIYGYLANQYTNVSVVNNAKMVRARSSKEDNFKPMFLYYELRNFHLFEEYTLRFTNKGYPFIVKLRHYTIAISILVRTIFLKRNFNFKIKLISAVIRGVIDSKRRKVNSSY